MKICQFGFCIINSIPKMLDLNTLKPFFYIFIVHASLKIQRKFTIHPKKRGPITPSGHTPFSHYHANSVAVIKQSCPEKRANHAIKPCITFTPQHQLFCCFMNYVLKKWPITPSHQPLGVPPILGPILI